MEIINIHGGFNQKLFNENLKIYRENFHTSDHLVFNLVEQYINSDLNVSNINDETTLIEENMLNKNKQKISYKLNKSQRNMLYWNLKKEFEILKELIIEYNSLLKYYDIEKKLNKHQNLKLNSLIIKLIYLLIELKVNLNIPLDDIANENIYSYCDCITFDIVNKKYESLSISKHIYDNKLILQKKN